MRHLVWSSALLAGCLNPTIERPRYAEVLWDRAIDVAFDTDDTLWVLSTVEGGGLAIGTVDVGGADRAVSSVAITKDGAPLDTLFGNGGSEIADWFSFAIHPGTGTPWLFHKGAVGPVVDGVFTPQLDVATPSSGGTLGTIAFYDDATLLVSAERIDQSDERTDAIPVDGDVADAAAAAPFTVVTADGVSQALWGVCDLEVLDGTLYFVQCGGGSNLYRADQVVLPDFATPENGRSEISPVAGDFVATSPWGAVAQDDQPGGAYCAEPWRDDAHSAVVSKGSYWMEGLCRGADARLPSPARAALSRDGATWAAVYDNAAVVLLDEKSPKDTAADVTGTWCSTVSVDGVTQSMTLAEDGTLSFSNPQSEILHAELRWKRKGDKIAFDYLGYTQYETSDAHYEHWAVRVGDTLHVKSTTDADSYDSLIGSGYKDVSGLWVPCG